MILLCFVCVFLYKAALHESELDLNYSQQGQTLDFGGLFSVFDWLYSCAGCLSHLPPNATQCGPAYFGEEVGPAGREEAETILCLGGCRERSLGVPFQNPGFKGTHGWVWVIKRRDNCPPRSGIGVTNTEWIAVDAEASLGPMHLAGFDCFYRSPYWGVSRAALFSSAGLRSPTPWCASCLLTIHLWHFSPFPRCHDPAGQGIPPVLRHMPHHHHAITAFSESPDIPATHCTSADNAAQPCFPELSWVIFPLPPPSSFHLQLCRHPIHP